MAERSEIVAAARSYLGVRFRHQGRSRERGVDCVGLIIVVGRDVGAFAPGFDFTSYRRHPDGMAMRAKCNEHLEPIAMSEAGPGDIMLFRGRTLPCHLGILTPGVRERFAMTHAFAPYRKVAENDVTRETIAQLCGCYRFPGLKISGQQSAVSGQQENGRTKSMKDSFLLIAES